MTSLICAYIGSPEFDKSGYIAGIRPILEDGKIHFVSQKRDSRVYYFVYDWSFGSHVSYELHDKTLFRAPTIWIGSRTELTVNPPVLKYQSYTATTKMDF